MQPILGLLRILSVVNGGLLALGRALGCLGLALMVAVILLQVVCRYAFNDALPWPDEAARFLMLWLTGLMSPTAYRRGGFVAINMFGRFLPKAVAGSLGLALLLVSLLILVVGCRIGYAEVTGFGGRFATASLYLPLDTGLTSWYRLPRSWMMASLLVGSVLLVLVNVELILRQILILAGHDKVLPPIPGSEQDPDTPFPHAAAGAE